jgi:hypothetical protein
VLESWFGLPFWLSLQCLVVEVTGCISIEPIIQQLTILTSTLSTVPMLFGALMVPLYFWFSAAAAESDLQLQSWRWQVSSFITPLKYSCYQLYSPSFVVLGSWPGYLQPFIFSRWEHLNQDHLLCNLLALLNGVTRLDTYSCITYSEVCGWMPSLLDVHSS